MNHYQDIELCNLLSENLYEHDSIYLKYLH